MMGSLDEVLTLTTYLKSWFLISEVTKSILYLLFVLCSDVRASLERSRFTRRLRDILSIGHSLKTVWSNQDKRSVKF